MWNNGLERVEYPGAEDQPRSNGAMVDVLGAQACGVDVVIAPQHDGVDEGHADEQWDDAQGHDLVFAEQPIVADFAATEAKQDHGEGACGAPPAEEQSGVVLHSGVRLRRRGGVEASRKRHCKQSWMLSSKLAGGQVCMTSAATECFVAPSRDAGRGKEMGRNRGGNKVEGGCDRSYGGFVEGCCVLRLQWPVAGMRLQGG